MTLRRKAENEPTSLDRAVPFAATHIGCFCEGTAVCRPLIPNLKSMA
jgi:hypothetical protein